MKLKPNQKFWAELEVTADHKIKVKKAQRYTIVNQHLKGWMPIESRTFARELNKVELVTR